MLYDKALEQLESLLDDPYYMGKIPYKKGNSIRIGHYIIRKNKTGYLVYDCVDNKKIDHFWSKSAALAYVKLDLDGKKLHTEIKKLDKTLEKNQIDAMFYRNTIKKASEEIRKSSARVRLDIAEENAYNAKYRLIGLIFDN
tara:strand:+ start:996 stop:1418 length:423 start_codon:yes stop_codon:yes gene_type:complete